MTTIGILNGAGISPLGIGWGVRVMAILLLAGPWSLGSAQAQFSRVDVRPGQERTGKVEVGKPITLSFVVTNDANAPVTVTDEVQAVVGMRAVFDANPYVLQPGERQTRLVTVIAPRFLEAGTYDISFQVRNATGELSRPAVNSMIVEALMEFDVREIGPPSVVRAGETYLASFRLENRGNTTIEVALEAKVSEGLQATVSEAVVQLKPSSQKEVIVSGPIPEKWKGPQDVTVKLETSITDRGTRRHASATSEADVLAERGPEMEYYRYPLSIGASAGSMQSGYSGSETYVRTLAQGAGALREGGSTFLDFDVRTPTNTQRVSALTQQDRYVVNLRNNWFGATVGDLSASSSPISGAGIFGFGGQGSLNLKYLEANFYHAENRLSFREQTETGGGIVLKPLRGLAVGARLADRQDDYAPGKSLTLTSSISPAPGHALEGEYGTGNVPGTQSQPHTYSIRARTSFPGLSVRGQYYHADPLFPSARSNQSSGGASFSARPTSGWALDGNYFFNRFGGLSIREDIPAPFFASHMASVGVGYDARRAVRLRVGYDLMGRLAELGNQRNGAWQHLGFLEMTARLGALFVSARPSAGVAVPTGRPQQLVVGGTLAMDVRLLNDKLGLNASARHFEGPYGGIMVDSGSARQSSMSLSGTARIRSRTTATLRVSGNYQQAGAITGFGVFGQMGIDHTLPWGHVISLAGVLTDYSSGGRRGGDRYYEMAFNYTVPLRLPVQKSRKTGLVSGRLVDGDTGRGLSGAAVFLGSAATLTGTDGRFYVPHVEPGEQRFRLEHSESSKDYVLRDPQPYVVHGGRNQKADLVAVLAASVRGTVTIRGDRPDSDLPEIPTSPGSGVVVRLLGPGTDRYTISDATGAFVFRGIPNGTYNLQIDPTSIGDLLMEEGRADVTLFPGESRDVPLVLRERRSVIQFQSLESASKRSSGTPGRPVVGPPPGEYRAGPISQPQAVAEGGYSLHVVRPGDTLRSLSRLYYNGDSEPWSLIYELNRSLIPDPDVLPVGSTLRIREIGNPAALATAASSAPATAPAPTPKSPPKATVVPLSDPVSTQGAATHVVRPGDTLMNLSRMYFNGDPYQWTLIYEANRSVISDPGALPVGLTLRVPGASNATGTQADAVRSSTSVPVATNGFTSHVVRPGDTLRSLARMYFNGNSDPWALIYEVNRNLIANPDVLPVGVTLRIPNPTR